MSKTPLTGHRRRIARLDEKNITRRHPHTLRSRLSSENAGPLNGFILIHGATDANGR